MIAIEAIIENYGENLLIGYIPKFKGLVVQGKTIDEIKKELFTSLRVKIAYDYDLDIKRIQTQEIKSLNDLKPIKGKTDNEYKLELPL